MRRFKNKIFLFVLPILILFLLEGFLPASTFTYRPWEALDFRKFLSINREFYPNAEIRIKSVGQLCHHTPFAIQTEEMWKIDKLGNRNDTYYEDPDIILIGDSYVVGAALTQDSILSNQLQRCLGDKLKIYNIAPARFSKLDYYFKSGMLKKPKVVIFLKSERYVPRALEIYKHANSYESKIKTALINLPFASKVSIFFDKVIRHYSKNWVQARLSEQKGDGVPGVAGSNMFFFNTAAQPYDPNMMYDPENDLKRTKNTIVSYKNYCDSLGIDFLFLPMPNKATVYYDFVPSHQQPNYVFKLDSMLHNEGVETINTLQLFNDYRKLNKQLLYHLDDTHWNGNGVNLVSKAIANKIKSDPVFLAEKKLNIKL